MKETNITVYKRKSDGKWVGCADLTGTAYADRSKKRDRKVVYGKTKKEATMKINKYMFELENGIVKKKIEMSVMDFLNMYYERNISSWENSTKELYKIYLKKHFEPYFSDMEFKSLSPIKIDDFYEYKMEELSSNTVLKLHKFFSAAMSWGVKKEIIESNICSKVDAPKLKKYVPNVYDEEKFMHLWESVQNKYDKVYIALGAGGGLRRGEILGLTWNDIDFKNNMVSINKTRVHITTNIDKGTKNESSERVVAVPEYVIDVLKWYRKSKKVVNMNEHILQLTPQYLSQRFSYILDVNGLDHIRLHDLRHYNATIMACNGVPDIVAAARLGHANTQTLKSVYQHALKSADQVAVDSLKLKKNRA